MKSMKRIAQMLFGALLSSKQLKIKAAFTLAEMLVVVLVMSIVLAAMAPLISTKMKNDIQKENAVMGSSIWNWTDDETGIYFGPGGKESVTISQKTSSGSFPQSDEALLILNTITSTLDTKNTGSNHILFKEKGYCRVTEWCDQEEDPNCEDTYECDPDTVFGWLKLYDKTINLGSIPLDSEMYKYARAILIGSAEEGTTPNSNGDTPFYGSVIMGQKIKSDVQKAVVIGHNAAGGNYSVSIGYGVKGTGVAIGKNAEGEGVVIGHPFDGNAKSNGGVAIGAGAQSVNGIAIGKKANQATTAGVAIGQLAKSDSVAIGKGKEGASVCAAYCGTSSNKRYENIYGRGDILLGYEATSISTKGSAIGYNAQAPGRYYGQNNSIMFDDYETITLSTNDQYDEQGKLNKAESTVYIPGDLVVGGRAYIGDNLENDESLFLGMVNGSSTERNMYSIRNAGLHNYSSPDPFVQIYKLANPVYSDSRLKYVGKENKDGLDKIRQIKVFNYTFKKDKTKEPHVGVIAQDLQKIFPNAVKKAADGFLTIRMEDMFYALINAVKRLDIKYQAREKRIKTLKNRISKLEKYIEELEKNQK